MKFVPYALLGLSFYLGFSGQPVAFVGLVAVLATVLLFAPRRRALKEQPQAPDQNMALDGAFLLTSQLLIHIVAGGLGVFISRMLAG